MRHTVQKGQGNRMTHRLTAVAVLSLLLPASPRVGAGAQERGTPQARGIGKILGLPRVRNEFIVKFKAGAPEARKAAALGAAGAAVKRALRPGLKDPAARPHLVSIPAGTDEGAALKALQADPAVEHACPNYLRKASVVPNDPSFGTLWGLHNTGQGGGTADADIDAPEAWDLTTGSAGVVVAVLDTGVDFAHPDLDANRWVNPGETAGDGVDNDGNGRIDDINGWDFVFNDNNPNDANGHGTHVSGTIGARGNNSTGVVGVNWTIQIMGLRFLDANGSGSDADAIDAYDYAVDLKLNHGINLVAINNSWGGGGFNAALQTAFLDAQNAGILSPSAAGNEGANNDEVDSFPADFPLEGVISVGASDRNDRAADFSNFGRLTVDLFAPGVEILSTTPGNTYSTFSGTSMATPHVTGAIGLLAALHPGDSLSRRRARLVYNTDRRDGFEGRAITCGRLNVFRALQDDENTAPDAVSTLAASDPSYSAVRLDWTATGDDASTGTAAAYDIRYSTSPIDAGNFDAASVVHCPPLPTSPGSAQTVRACGLASSTTYHFAMKVIDNLGNASAISNTATAATLALGTAITGFFDDFEAGGAGPVNPAKWTAQAPWGEESLQGSIRGSDSPAGNYANDLDISLTTVSLNLAALRDVSLVFTHRHALEYGYDYGIVEASPDGGANWDWITQFTGTLGAFATVSRLCLDAYDGLPNVKVRFRLLTDFSVVAAGWRIDDVTVLGDASPNNAPTADPQTVNVTQDTPTPITLTGSDPDGDPLTFAIGTGPANGVLTGSAPNVTYTPNAGTTGADSFTFTVSDGAATSAPATVTINVAAVSIAALKRKAAPRSGYCGLTGLEAIAFLALAGALRRSRVKRLRP